MSNLDTILNTTRLLSTIKDQFHDRVCALKSKEDSDELEDILSESILQALITRAMRE